MKKILFCLSLILVFSCIALPCLAAQFEAEGVFTIIYDKNDFEVDTTSYADENVDDTYHWYGLIYNDDYAIDMTMFDYEDLEKVTLFTLDEDERQQYVDFMLDAFSDDHIQFIGALDVSQYNIPFYFFSCQDSEGEYLFAETVVKGKAIRFAIYYNDADLGVDQDLLDSLTVLVGTFLPVA